MKGGNNALLIARFGDADVIFHREMEFGLREIGRSKNYGLRRTSLRTFALVELARVEIGSASGLPAWIQEDSIQKDLIRNELERPFDFLHLATFVDALMLKREGDRSKRSSILAADLRRSLAPASSGSATTLSTTWGRFNTRVHVIRRS